MRLLVTTECSDELTCDRESRSGGYRYGITASQTSCVNPPKIVLELTDGVSAGRYTEDVDVAEHRGFLSSREGGRIRLVKGN